MVTPIHIHPDNPKLFEFRDKPLVLLTATEHYGAVINRPFRFEQYLADAAEKGITLTRLFMLFRELQTSINPYSTCKPETPDFIAPFERTGPGRAIDQELKYDLDQPNPEYFRRLHDFLSLASNYGIIVEVVLLSNTYTPSIWGLNPLNAANNVNDMDEIQWPEYMSMRNEKLFTRQSAHVRKIVTETNSYDNIIYEICNEPGGQFGGSSENPSLDEVNAWLDALIRVIRETEAPLPNKHLVVGQQAFSYDPWEQPSDRSFKTMDYDVVNMHPLPNTTHAGKRYDLGDFMSKQLTLRAMRDFGLATYSEPKPLNQDEDNVASQYKDEEAWTIHRKRAWMTLLTGNHYDYIDFSIIPRQETGTPESQRGIRTWMKHLSAFIHSMDLIHSRPLPGFLKSQPEHTLEIAFGIPGQDIAIYLADERELVAARDLPEPEPVMRGPGGTINGAITLDLPDGTY
ncbi:MAG: glycoside hydrolase family 5 protein, partial [Anaerolineae bacterium]|nr:glycoside hydrolase family 5 protein [Anaerolineae bacterium]